MSADAIHKTKEQKQQQEGTGTTDQAQAGATLPEYERWLLALREQDLISLCNLLPRECQAHILS